MTNIRPLNDTKVIEARAVIQHIIATEGFFDKKDLMEIDFFLEKKVIKNYMMLIQLAMCIEHKLGGVEIPEKEIAEWNTGNDVINTYVKYSK